MLYEAFIPPHRPFNLNRLLYQRHDVKVVGISNPATEFCLQQKGFINPTTVNGKQVNICELPNGQKVEVNEFYKISGGSEQSHYTP